MSDLGEQYFPATFIPDYIHFHPSYGVKRILTYTIFRIFSYAGKENRELAHTLKETLFPYHETFDYGVIEDFLHEDCYFCPSFEENSFDLFFLYAAICIMENALDESSMTDDMVLVDQIIFSMYPVLSSANLDDERLVLDTLVQSPGEFYAALYLALTRYSASLRKFLPKFTEIYCEDYHFTCEDFVLYNFMDEYFETKNCRMQPDYREMTDTLVQATLGYYKTDLETLVVRELSAMLHTTSSRLSVVRQFGSIQLLDSHKMEYSTELLYQMLLYAAEYELRNHLYDYHLDEDTLVTLKNWKDKLRWHYVQYANVFTPALDAFYAAVLSEKILKKEWTQLVSTLCN